MFSLTITTVDKQLFSGEVYAAIVPGSGGELTVLANHMPFITTLAKGTIRVKWFDPAHHKEKKDAHSTIRQAHGGEQGRTTGSGQAEERTFSVERGLLEVSNNNAVILI